MRNHIVRIMLWALVPLVIPVFGVLFVDGWNWTWNDFVFAWVFFVVAISVFRFARTKVHSRAHKNLMGLGVVLIFVAVWAMLATG